MSESKLEQREELRAISGKYAKRVVKLVSNFKIKLS